MSGNSQVVSDYGRTTSVTGLKRAPARKVRFATFEVDLAQKELRKGGLRVRLEHKSFRILELLLRAPGELVRREELALHLWPGVHVGFERGLNTAMNKLRQVLGDSFHQCRFIETRSGLGYRFMAPVEEIVGDQSDQADASDARKDYLRGRYFLGKMTEDDTRKGIAHFESAIEQDPQYAPAHAGLADAYCQMAIVGTGSVQALCLKAKESAVLAVSGDSTLAAAHISLARVRMLFDRNWKGAQAACLRALDLQPRLADAHCCYSTLLSATQGHEEAVRESQAACSLDPLSLTAGAGLAWALHLAGRYESAVEQCWKVLTLEPKFSIAQYTLGLAYEQLGQVEDAITEFENAVSCSGYQQSAAISALGHAHAKAGETTQARMALGRLASPYWRSLIHVGLDEPGMALDLIQRARAEGDAALLWFDVDPRFGPIRSGSQVRTSEASIRV